MQRIASLRSGHRGRRGRALRLVPGGLVHLFLSLPRTGTTVVTVGRTASGETVLGGDVSFFGFLTIFWPC